jgi:hypothetical protein
MSNRMIVWLCAALILTFAIVALIAHYAAPRTTGIRSQRAPASSTTAPEERAPAPLPIPSVPDTAAPVVPTEPTTTSTLAPRPRPTSTSTTSAPRVQGASETISSDDAAINAQLYRIHECEQPGDAGWSHRGPTYQGGLGLYYRTWLGFRPAGAPDNAGDASIEQQLAAGRAIVRRYGFSAWGCAARLGLA